MHTRPERRADSFRRDHGRNEMVAGRTLQYAQFRSTCNQQHCSRIARTMEKCPCRWRFPACRGAPCGVRAYCTFDVGGLSIWVRFPAAPETVWNAVPLRHRITLLSLSLSLSLLLSSLSLSCCVQTCCGFFTVSLKQIWFNAARGMKCSEGMCMSKHGAFGCTVLSSFGTND